MYVRTAQLATRYALFALICTSVVGQVPGADASSCRSAATEFYQWYVPLLGKRSNGPAWDVALQHRSPMFSPELLQALKSDSETQRRAKGEIVGIDFDPFVGGQDPADHYEVRRITLQDRSCLVEVWSTPSDTRIRPDVIAELSYQNGRWRFLNFRYPDENTDLVTVLMQLRKSRRRN